MSRVGSALAWLLVLPVAAACSGDDAVDTTRRQRPDLRPATSERLGVLDDLPRYPGSRRVASPNVERGTVAQTFGLDAAIPKAVIDFYVTRLDDWDLISRRRLSATARRARFVRDETRLTVSVSAAPTLEGDDAASDRSSSLQYSIVLESVD